MSVAITKTAYGEEVVYYICLDCKDGRYRYQISNPDIDNLTLVSGASNSKREALQQLAAGLLSLSESSE